MSKKKKKWKQELHILSWYNSRCWHKLKQTAFRGDHSCSLKGNMHNNCYAMNM